MGNVILKPTRLPARNPHSSHIARASSAPPTPPRRRKKKGKLFQGVLVTLGAMMLAVLAVKASDSFMPPSRDLLGGVGASTKDTRCPSDMVYVSNSNGGFCIDRYEASPGKLCPNLSPTNQFDTTANLSQTLCTPVSVKDADPWTNVPLSQAMELCARVGKHLPSNGEWYRAALGTPDEVSDGSDPACVLGRIGMSRAEKSGAYEKCVSSAGAYDMVGNVWEWVDANVVDGTYGGRMLPNEGYVSEADTDGVAVQTSDTTSLVFHGDYLYLNRTGVQGMFRGGSWNLTEKAGPTAVFAASPTSFVGIAVGFRCAR